MRRARTALFVLCLLATCTLAHGDEGESVKRLYRLDYLAPNQAMLELHAAYPASMNPGIEMRPEAAGGVGFLRVTAPAADQEAIARVLREKDVAPPSFRLQFVLLDALDTSLPEPELPGSAAGALKDVRTLFPFKGYRVRDTAVLPAAQDASATMGSVFMLSLDARPASAERMEVRKLRLLGQGVLKGQDGFADLLGTSFSIKRGETVVLGTSTVSADKQADRAPKALILLVTALP